MEAKQPTPMASPIKIREAQRMIRKAGGTINTGGTHLKVTHPQIPGSFTLPAHGSKGRSTLSPGATKTFLQFHALMLEAKAAA